MRLSDYAALLMVLACISLVMDTQISLKAAKSFGLSGRELKEYVELSETEARER